MPMTELDTARAPGGPGSGPAVQAWPSRGLFPGPVAASVPAAGSREGRQGMVPPHAIWDPRDAGPRERKKTAMWSSFYTVLLRAPSSLWVEKKIRKLSSGNPGPSASGAVLGFSVSQDDNSSHQQPCGEVPLLSPF